VLIHGIAILARLNRRGMIIEDVKWGAISLYPLVTQSSICHHPRLISRDRKFDYEAQATVFGHPAYLKSELCGSGRMGLGGHAISMGIRYQRQRLCGQRRWWHFGGVQGYRRHIARRRIAQAGRYFGIRYWDFDTKLTPPVLPIVRRSTAWTDGYVGARFSSSFSDKWSWVLRANVGAGESDLALGLELDFRRKFASGNRFTAGLRVLDIDYEDSSGSVPLDLDMSFSGLTVGYTFNL
jgi:hypothetical protein